MPQVIYSPGAIRDLQRLRNFLFERNQAAANRAVSAIRKAFRSVGTHPLAGRTVDDLPEEIREWIIPFGNSGYIARYLVSEDTVTILAIRHQLEVGYHNS
ncbi:MAG: type II toxin-antitoxin system RelE/ParE family toxin [Acidithiobacillus sp.]|jgi:plasmid stabilization system protein ParE|nr:type II toxin-antitoxin system RelE/ParE family toxin [Acidithiobacillus sp.]